MVGFGSQARARREWFAPYLICAWADGSAYLCLMARRPNPDIRKDDLYKVKPLSCCFRYSRSCTLRLGPGIGPATAGSISISIAP